MLDALSVIYLSAAMNTTKYVSFNIKGINNAVKRKKLLCWLKKEKANIVLLQETHLDDNEHEKLKREWVRVRINLLFFIFYK